MQLQQIIKVKDNNYTVVFPNVGQIIEIESMKLSFTKNRYVAMSMSDLQNHNYILDLADAVSYLSVLIPNLKQDLNIPDWWKLDAFTSKELILAYKKQFIPWFKPLLEQLYRYEEEGEQENGTNS